MSAGEQYPLSGPAVTPARAERAARILLQAIAQAQAILSAAPAAVSAGDQELASELLPAWWTAFGCRAVSVGDLWSAHEATQLAQVLRRLEQRAASTQSARKGCGHLLKRLADSGAVVAGFSVLRLAVQGGVAVWECRPATDPQNPA